MRLTCSIDIGLIYNYPIDINPPIGGNGDMGMSCVY